MSSKDTKVITPAATLSYPHLDKPVQDTDDEGKPKGKPKYSCTLIFPVGTDLRAMEAAAEAAGRAKWGDKYPVIKKGFRNQTFRTDTEEKGYPDGSTFVNARTEAQPGMVFSHADPNDKSEKPRPTKVALEQIVDVFYAGSVVRASLNAFAYETKGNRGVAFGLNNLQKIKDGPRLDNRKAAEDEFTPDLSAAPASLEDLQ